LSAISVNTAYEMTQNTTNKLWQDFERKIRVSMYGNIQAKKELLQKEKNLSPEQVKLIRDEIRKDRERSSSPKKKLVPKEIPTSSYNTKEVN